MIPTRAQGEANPVGRNSQARRRSAVGEWPRAKIWSPERGEVGIWPRGNRGANLGADLCDCAGLCGVIREDWEVRGIGLGRVERVRGDDAKSAGKWVEVYHGVLVVACSLFLRTAFGPGSEMWHPGEVSLSVLVGGTSL